MAARKATTADGYVRVSRRAGREGESFISPEVQRKKIADWAKLHEVEIDRWWEEIDASGARLERPLFQEALARCERGETGGIVVARLDRFARSAVDALESIKRLNEAGARLVSVEDNFDGSTPMGRFAIGILTLIAELELERIKESWTTAVRSAVDRGIHISARPPTGYVREDKTKRLVRVEPAASAVAEVFRRRALGASYAELARYLEEQGVLPPTGNPHWSGTGIAGLLRNRAYLGEARSGSVVNPQGHEPIVSQAEFDAAQGQKTLLSAPELSLSAEALLKGIARCAGCGHTLKISGTFDTKLGRRVPNYYCVGRYAKGHCPARASIAAEKLDRYVEEQALAALRAEGGLFAQAVEASAQVELAAHAVGEAEHELDLYLTSELMSVIGQERFLQGVDARQQTLDRARAELNQLRAQSTLAEELTSGDLITAWPELSIQERRQLLHGLLDRVLVKRSDGRKRDALPLSERTQIILRGNVLLTEPGQAPTT
jgi:site-specific DNA recombinase